jgi:hypothetical protein
LFGYITAQKDRCRGRKERRSGQLYFLKPKK